MVSTPDRVSSGLSRHTALDDDMLRRHRRFSMRRFTIPLLVVAVLLMSIGAVSVRTSAVAQEATPSAMNLAEHPLTGAWAVMTPGGVNPQTHGADGSLIVAFPPNYVDPVLGLTFQGPALGRWESTGARSGRLTFLQALSGADGAYVGTYQLAADIEASEDGQTWVGNTPPRIILRDAGNAVIFDEVVPAEPPVTATRIGATFESVVLPVATSTGGTPTP